MSRSAPLLQTLRPQPFSVRSCDGVSIEYDLYDQPSSSAVLVVPGFWRTRRYPSMLRLAHFLSDLGYRAAICDLRGHGGSGGMFGFNLHEHHDISAVAADLVERTGIEQLTLLGFSYGGSISISAAARHEMPIASIIAVSPVADFKMLAPRVNPFTIHRHIAFSLALQRPRFHWRLSRAPKLRALDDVASVRAPLCLIHVKNDWLVNHRHSAALYERATEPKELHVIDIAGNYHADRAFAATSIIATIVADFLQRYTPK